MTAICIIGDEILLDGVPIAHLLPSVRLSIRDRLTAVFDALDEDETYIAELEGRITRLEATAEGGCPMTRPLAPPPVTCFRRRRSTASPNAEIDTRWLKARFASGYPLYSEVKGWLLDETIKRDRRAYLFEVSFSDERSDETEFVPPDWRNRLPGSVVSACDPSNPNPFEDRAGDGKRQLTGLPEGARPDLHRRAVLAARHLRELALAQQQWLLDRFETAVPVNAIRCSTGEPPS